MWTDDKVSVINWGDPKDMGDGQKIKGMMKVNELREIKDGLVKSKIRDKNAAQRMACTFSVLTAGRTLELECPTIVLFIAVNIR